MSELTQHDILSITMFITIIFSVIVIIKLRKKHDDEIKKLKQSIEKTVDKRLDTQRSITKGNINEQVSPYMPEFSSKYAASDARFLGSPIDFVIFKNMSQYKTKTKALDIPIDVILVEVKTGKNKTLTEKEKAIKIACEEGRVSFDKIDIEESDKNL
jgi:predicted Holliday junction resolvase-like endonuclease